MAKRNKKILSKKNLIFCEGQTEKIFISFLKKIFKSKIDIKYENLKGEVKDKKIFFTLNHKYKNINKIFVLHDFEHKIQFKKEKNFYVIISNPSIEIIILFFLKEFEESKLETFKKCKVDNIIKEIEKITETEYSKKSKDLTSFFEKKGKLINKDYFQKNIKKLKKIDKNNTNISFNMILGLLLKNSI